MRPSEPASSVARELSAAGGSADEQWRVDIGIPTLGRSRLLIEAIESVLAQSVQSWRLVISENGEPDPALAKALAPYVRDPRITHRSTGRLLSSASNHSLLIATGSAPYVALLHDDDVWDPLFLERRLRFLDDHPECGLVFSGTRQADEFGRDLGRVRQVLREGLYSPEEFSLILLDPRRAGTLLPAPTVSVVRREAYEAVGPAFAEGFPLTFDSEMLMRLAVRYPVGYLEGWDATYRLHPQQTSFNKHWGEELLRRQATGERLVRSHLPQVQLALAELARHRSRAHLIAALDAAEDGRGRDAVTHLRSAIWERPSVLVDARTLTTLLALVSGRRGRRVLARGRTRVLRRHMRRRYEAAGERSPFAGGQSRRPGS